MTSAPPAKLDPTAAIGEALKIYGQQAAILIPAALAIYALQFVAVLAAPSSAAGAIVLAIVSVLVSTLYTGTVVRLVIDVQDGKRDSTLGSLVKSVLPVVVPLILVSLLTGIIVGLGFLLIIVPGFIALTLLAVVAPVTVVERPGIFAALGRSRSLVKGSGWQVFAVIVFVFVLSIGVSRIVGLAGSDATVRGVLTWVAGALVAPASALATSVTYVRLREIKGEPITAEAAPAV